MIRIQNFNFIIWKFLHISKWLYDVLKISCWANAPNDPTPGCAPTPDHISDVTKLCVLGPYPTQILCQHFHFDCSLETFQVICVLFSYYFVLLFIRVLFSIWNLLTWARETLVYVTAFTRVQFITDLFITDPLIRDPFISDPFIRNPFIRDPFIRQPLGLAKTQIRTNCKRKWKNRKIANYQIRRNFKSNENFSSVTGRSCWFNFAKFSEKTPNDRRYFCPDFRQIKTFGCVLALPSPSPLTGPERDEALPSLPSPVFTKQHP